MRDKWDRTQSGSTYGMITLTKAVKKCTAFYSPMMATAEEDFNDILQKLTEFELIENKRYQSGDIGYERLFADVFKAIARYVPERKKWFVYDRKRWVPDIANLKIMELGKDLADAMWTHFSKWYESILISQKLRMKSFAALLRELMFTNQKRCREQELRNRQSASIGTSLVQSTSQQSKQKRHNLQCYKLCRIFTELRIP